MARHYTKKQIKGFSFLIVLSYCAIFLVSIIKMFIGLVWYQKFLFILGTALLIVIIKKVINQIRNYKDERRRLELDRYSNLEGLKKMSPIKFEHYIGNLFRQWGYDAEVTKSTGDGGKDIIIRKKDFHGVVECKRYVKNKVTRPHIQKFHSAIIDTYADLGFFVTTAEFTSQAMAYVKDKPIILIDGNMLVRLIEETIMDSESCENDLFKLLVKLT